jgi:nucleolar GTP-binding protein
MNLVVLPKSGELLDAAFGRARKEAAMLKSERNPIKDAKGKNIKRIEVSSNYVAEALHNAVAGFPSMKEVTPFYRELMASTIDMPLTLKALGHISAERKIILKIKGANIGRLKGLEREEARKAAPIVKEFYGRMAGLLRKLDKSIEYYNRAAKKLRELPHIKEMPTAIIAGYPNTGKSTMLGRITKSQPRVAAYPFTTKKLEIGHLIHNYFKVQFIDTPGLLDRLFDERNQIEKKGVAALRHLADALIFVVDPTLQCGFPLDKQVSLLNEIRKEFEDLPVFVVVNKADVATEEEMERAKKAFPSAFIEGQGIESGVGKKAAELILKKACEEEEEKERAKEEEEEKESEKES